jgi:hypothetical protein
MCKPALHPYGCPYSTYPIILTRLMMLAAVGIIIDVAICWSDKYIPWGVRPLFSGSISTTIQGVLLGYRS